MNKSLCSCLENLLYNIPFFRLGRCVQSFSFRMVIGRVENRTRADTICGLFKSLWMPLKPQQVFACSSNDLHWPFSAEDCLWAPCLSQQRPQSAWKLLPTPTLPKQSWANDEGWVWAFSPSPRVRTLWWNLHSQAPWQHQVEVNTLPKITFLLVSSSTTLPVSPGTVP